MFPARGRAVAAHRSHKPKVAGSNPALASNKYARPSERMHESGINGRATPPKGGGPRRGSLPRKPGSTPGLYLHLQIRNPNGSSSRRKR
jgi:poly(3-hydroxybutyrate) depolymerase